MRLLPLILAVLWVQLYAQNPAFSEINQHRSLDTIFLSTDLLDFEEMPKNTSSLRSFEITNYSQDSVLIENISFNSAYFRLHRAPKFPLTILSGSTCTFTVHFIPVHAAIYKAKANIFSPQEKLCLLLTGTCMPRRIKSPSNTFTCHPNPARDYIRVSHINKTPKHYHLYLRDILGDHVYTFYESIDAESDLDLFAKVPEIMPGQYYLVLMSGEDEVAEALQIE